MIILEGIPFDTYGLSEVRRIFRPSQQRRTITGYLTTTKSRYVQQQISCNLLVGRQDLDRLTELYARHVGYYDLVDFRGFSWLTQNGTNDANTAYNTGADFVMGTPIDPPPQQFQGYDSCNQHWIVPVQFVVNARGLNGDSATPDGNTEVNMVLDVPAGTINGVNPTFTITQTYGLYILFKNGVNQRQGEDYTLSGTTITFISGAIPQTGDTLYGYGVLN